ncbi:hypothetical protein HOV04_gp79 [Xanthomonas phage XcP1]|uniref:Uncharacterized protein n=1 Tax=Xanthomonas phage XcP1 TaxID=2785027 RepID=A0A3S7L8L4_9CAUD|nr:hypothetical protein HOV04_gp79 [Xanthomonas phage XcP1]AWN08581.1 hypothetical protein XcP1_079 [Xanthomonas phage XcP1]
MIGVAGVALWCIFLLIIAAMVGAFLRVWKCPRRRGGHRWKVVSVVVGAEMIREDQECTCCGRRESNWY